MAGLNKAILVGRIGKDPDIRRFDGGGVVANFTMATSEHYKDKVTGEKKEITDWHNIRVSGPMAEVVEKYVKKGHRLCVEGKMRTRSWEKNGETRYITEVHVENLQLIERSSAPSSDVSFPASEPAYQNEPAANVASDDLPF